MFGDSFTDIEMSPHKYMLHADKFRALAEGKDTYPVTAEVDIYGDCNHKCWWCVDPKHTKAKLEMPFIEKLLDEFSELGVMGIVYKGGGEPALHKDFPQILELTRKKGFEEGIVTNGSRLHKYYEPVADYSNYLRVSIDGPSSGSHRKIHGTRDFEKIVEGTGKVVKRRYLNGSRHPIIGLSFAMDYPMIGQIGDAVRLGDSIGVDYVLFRTPFFEEVGRKSTMTPAEAQKVRDAFEEAKGKYRGNMKILVDHWISDKEASSINRSPTSPRRGSYMEKGANGIEHVTGRCLATPIFVVVGADRNVYPCCNLRSIDEWSIGKIDYDNGVRFRDVWEGELRKEALEKIHKTQCIRHCTHPLSKYNEVIEYLKSERYHGGFV